MLFVRGDGTVQDNTFDPAQVWGVQSTVPKSSVPLALQDVRSPYSSALGLSSVYEYKHLVAYLKANSRDKDQPLMPFRGKWMFTLGVSNASGHLYSFTLVVSKRYGHISLFRHLLLSSWTFVNNWSFVLIKSHCKWTFVIPDQRIWQLSFPCNSWLLEA